jgi:hypothetical protein
MDRPAVIVWPKFDDVLMKLIHIVVIFIPLALAFDRFDG